jgi:NAD(P)-dependent dehydrogenase (short-subunit alcohol dehydrogenase family)
MSEKRLALVTGGNRGIGLEVCRQLVRLDIQVILTARSSSKGQETVQQLSAEGLNVSFHQLDVTDQNSVRRLVKNLADHHGRLDILVNNAGIYIDRGMNVTEADLTLIRQTMETNFYGPLRLCQMLVPLMERNNYGRIVNLSSTQGSLHHMGGTALGYKTSKTAINVLTRVLAAELKSSNILVNSVDPGWVQTDMGGSHAPRSLEQGAETVVWLATLPDGGPTGGFFRDKRPYDW